MNQEKKIPGNRIVYFDFLRIWATLAVIVIHVSAHNWDTVSPRTWQWQVFSIYDSCVQWAVLVFVMMSGALCLRGSYSIRKIVTKNVLRFITAYFFWSAIYACINFLRGNIGLYGIIDAILDGHYHTWYLGMIAGLYLSVPLFKPIAESESATKYFLIIAFIFGFILPSVGAFSQYIPHPLVQQTVARLSSFIPQPATAYGFCFVCGSYLYKTDIPRTQRKTIYTVGILCLLITLLGTSLVSYRMNKPFTLLYNNAFPCMAGISIALFVYAKYHSFDRIPLKWRNFFNRLASYSFGVYLIHPLFIDLLAFRLHWDTLSFSPVLSVPIISGVVALLSFAASAAIHQIPVLRKYIV